MGKKSFSLREKQSIKETRTWQEIGLHTSLEDMWIVINGEIYDVSIFNQEHPGGYKTLKERAGRDATKAFENVGHT